MSQYGGPGQSFSPAPGGMGYGQAPEQGQYGAPQDPYAQQQQQGQYGHGQGGNEQQNQGYGQQPGAEQSQQGQQGQERQGEMGINEQIGQEGGMGQVSREGGYGQTGQQGGMKSAANRNPHSQGQQQQRTGAGAMQAAGRPGPAASHPHSRFHQDPHHHATMGAFHKIASQGLTPDHIHSLVHVGTLGLAMLAKNAGMTAGHEPEEEQAGR